MKYFLLLPAILIFFFPGIISAQTITNSSFESWTPSGKEPPFNWEEPTGWKSSNALTEWSSAAVTKSSEKQEGNYSVKLRSLMINEGWYSVICNGDPDLISNFSEPDIDIISGGEPLISAAPYPVGLQGYYKFTAPTVGDSAFAVVIMKKYDLQLNEYLILGYGSKALAPNTEFTAFEIPITYTNTSQSPDSFVVAFYSTKPDSPAKPKNFTETGILLVDNIAFTQTLSVKRAQQKQLFLDIYPNPANDHINLSWEGNNNQTEISILNMEGKSVFAAKLKGNNYQVGTKDFSPGLYMVQLKNASGITATKKFMIRK